MTLIKPTSNDNPLMMAPKGRVATQPNDQLVHQMVQVRPPNGASQPVGDGLVHYCISLWQEGGSTLCRPRRSTVQRRLVLVPPHPIRTPIGTPLEPHGIGSICLRSPCSRSPTLSNYWRLQPNYPPIAVCIGSAEFKFQTKGLLSQLQE